MRKLRFSKWSTLPSWHKLLQLVLDAVSTGTGGENVKKQTYQIRAGESEGRTEERKRFP